MQFVLVDVPQVLDNLEHQLRTLSNPVHPVLGQGVRHVVADVLGASVDQNLLTSFLELHRGQNILIVHLWVVHLSEHSNFKSVVLAQRLKDAGAAEVDQLQDLKVV